MGLPSRESWTYRIWPHSPFVETSGISHNAPAVSLSTAATANWFTCFRHDATWRERSKSLAAEYKLLYSLYNGVCILLRELSDHKTNLRSQQVSCVLYFVHSMLTTCFGFYQKPFFKWHYITKKLNGLSPRTNYTDRATAACRRSDCQLLRIEVPRGRRDASLRPYSRFSRQEPLLFYQVAPQLYSRGWVDPVPDPLLFFW
jgi:hypothetical protein